MVGGWGREGEGGGGVAELTLVTLHLGTVSRTRAVIVPRQDDGACAAATLTARNLGSPQQRHVADVLHQHHRGLGVRHSHRLAV